MSDAQITHAVRPSSMHAVPQQSSTAGRPVRWPMNNPNGPLQFWRLFRKLELQRGHGRLLIHGNGYWK